MYEKWSIVLIVIALLSACAQNGKQADEHTKRIKETSGLETIGILAKGME